MFNINALKKKIELSPIDESDLVRPKDFISTGVYSVNKIISGSIFKGVPTNRITTFYGESGCVPSSTKIYVAIKAEAEIVEFLESVENTSIFDKFFAALPIADKISILQDIGYSMASISRKTKLSRQTLYTLLNDNPSEQLKDRKENSSFYKISSFLRRNIYETSIRNVAEFYNKNIDFMVLTPVGFRKCSNLIDKGEKESIVLSAEGCKSTVVSVDHVMQLSDGKFDFAENILNTFSTNTPVLIKTTMGDKLITSMRRGGTIRMYDIEIDDECHTYYADGYVAHNSGKSLISAQLIINALKEKNYDMIFYIDTEGGVLYNKYEKSGIDMKKFMYISVSTIEECTTTLRNLYNDFEEQMKAAKSPDEVPKCMVVLDSLSGLVTNKVIDDATNGKVVQDMGLKAKLANTMVKSMMTIVMRTNCPLIVIAQAYDNPNAMGPQKYKEMNGGNGIKFCSHIVVQSSKSRKRQEDANKGIKGGDSYFSGNLIRYITYKNRIVKEGLEAPMFVDLNKGISKYAGLWDDAVRLGYIIQSGAWYTVPSYGGDKKFRRDAIENNDEMWNSFLNKMNEDFIRETAYGTGDAPVVSLNEDINEGLIQNEEN